MCPYNKKTVGMGNFIKHTLAATLGFIIASVVMGVVVLCVIVGIAMTDGNGNVTPKDNSVLVVKLSGQIVEHTTENPFDALLGGSAASQQGLDNIVGAIDKAAKSEEIRGIYIESGLVEADYATLQEIRNALVRFKTAKESKGKFVVAYADEYTQGAYYVCSAADKVWINPEGMLDIHGIAAQPMFLKDLMEKFGVKMKVVKVGKYKSATERYTEDRMSDENREQVTRYINGIWESVAKDICKSRNIPDSVLQRCADDHTLLRGTAYLKDSKLIDKTMYADEVKGEIKKLLGIDGKEEIAQIGCAGLNGSLSGNELSDNKIAVYYCEGSIVQAKEAGVLMGDAGIVSKTMTKDLDDLAKDDDIKAVIIRINSGGGDAFASEAIWHSVVELRKKKPVVVSMGGMAASGAYYLSAGASWIVAQPTTLTGSIGIFGAFPDMSGLMTEKLGLKFDNVKTNKHSDFSILQTARPFNAEEEAMLQQYINRGYELFCKRVADGRKIPVARVKEIAEGRVWLGMDAIGLKLVDELGGMPEAVRKAKALAKVKDCELVPYPAEDDWITQLTETASGHNNNLDEQLRTTLGAYYEPFIMIRNIQHQSPIQARSEIIYGR